MGSGASRRVFRRLTFGLPGSTLVVWMLTVLDSTVIILMKPGATSAPLDTAAILTIAGLSLVAVSVTGGIVGLQAQHLAETYSNSTARGLRQRSRWPLALVAQAVGVVYVTGAALLSPSLASGVAAGIWLAVGLSESGLVFWELLEQFDPVRIIRNQTSDALAELRSSRGPAPAAVIASGEPLRDVAARAAAREDPVVVTEALNGLDRILGRYLELHVPVYSDEFLGWLFRYLEELLERTTGSLAVQMALVDGAAMLGSRCALYRNPLNDSLDEGTAYSSELLAAVVKRADEARMRPLSEVATRAIVRLATDCVRAEKCLVAAELLRQLSDIAPTPGGQDLNVAAVISNGIAALVLAASQHPHDQAADLLAGEGVQALEALVATDHRRLGPAHWLTAPLAENSIQRVVLELARVSSSRLHGGADGWVQACEAAIGLCFSMPNNRDLPVMIRLGAADACEECLVSLISLGLAEVGGLTVEELVRQYVALALADTNGRFHTPAGLRDILLWAFTASEPSETDPFRASILVAVENISAAADDVRVRLSPVMRSVGAVALLGGDDKLARLCAGATMRLETAIRSPSFDVLDQHNFHRPGIPAPSKEHERLEAKARAHYLELEAEIKPDASRT